MTIETPKNLKAVDDSCDLLTPEQLAQLGLTAKPTHQKSGLGVPACDWNGDAFSIVIVPDTESGGLKHLYKVEEIAKESTVAGYPAVWIDAYSISCRVDVAVSQDALIGVSYFANVHGEEAKQAAPCKQAEKIAAMVLKNIPDA